MSRLLPIVFLLVGCAEQRLVQDGTQERQQIPGVTTPDPAVTGGQNSNPPLKPVSPSVVKVGGNDGEAHAMICNDDGDCTGSFSHCAKDVPDEVGICTKRCDGDAVCGEHWLCIEARWELEDTELTEMCAPTCVLNAECPRGTSCNDGYCGTPCSGGNCDLEAEESCESHWSLDCVGDAITWYNSCAEPEETFQQCGSGEHCLYGACVGASGEPSGGMSSGGGSCGGEVRKCASASTVDVQNGCGESLRVEACTGGKQCSAGVCRCGPSTQTRCVSGKLWKLDSCGNQKSIVGGC